MAGTKLGGPFRNVCKKVPLKASNRWMRPASTATISLPSPLNAMLDMGSKLWLSDGTCTQAPFRHPEV